MPDEFGRYELRALLGRGGMGEVFRAFDTVRDRTVALKLLPKHLAEDESFKTRFRRESRMAARLNEPHIIPIHDFGEIDGTLFIDMRLVEGEDLGSWLARRGTLPVETAVSVIGQIAAALDAAHESGLVHRDVKPSNILLTGISPEDDSNPFAYLVDFGIARSSTQEGTALTATSGTIGTVAYMSPERIGGEHGDRRTDIYALACVLYEALTGRKPFDGELFAIMFAHVNTPPPAVSAIIPDAPPGIDEVVSKGMAKDPEDRYPTAGALAIAARQAIREQPGAATRPEPPPPTPPPPSGPLPPDVPPPGGWSTTTPQPAAAAAATTVHSGPVPQGFTGQPGPQPGSPASTHPSGPIAGAGAANPTAPWRPNPPGSASPHTPLPPPGPVRPSLPGGPPGGWNPGGGSAPPPGYPPAVGPSKGRSRRTPILVGAALVVIAAVVVTLLVVLGKNDNTPNAKGTDSQASGGPVSTGVNTSSGQTSNGPSSQPAGTPSLPTGPASDSVTWAHFASFKKLVGTKDGDTNTFDHASCKLEGSEGSGDIAGITDQVKCTFASSPVVMYVARFTDATSVNTYLHKLLATGGYSVTPYSEGNHARGLEYVAPSGASTIDLTTTVCALPNYLVQFAVSDASASSVETVQSQYWNSSIFPDVLAPACRADFLGAADGTVPESGATADKPAFIVDQNTLKAFLARGGPNNAPTLVQVSTGYEAMVLGQTGNASFWTFDKTSGAITRVGVSSYPYEPDTLGAPNATGSGALLTGMADATFIVDGTFSNDGSGNSVAFTNGSNGWGAIKADKSDGNLVPSGKGVSQGGIGVSQAFGFKNGELMTADCSDTVPISQCGGNKRVIKFWTWDDSQGAFVISGTAGLGH